MWYIFIDDTERNSGEYMTCGKYIRTVEIREKNRKSNIGQTPWNKGIKGTVKLSDETRHKMSLAKQGTKNGMFGKSHSLTTIDKIKKHHIGMRGKQHSAETKEKMSQNNVGFKGKRHSLKTRMLMKKKRVEYLSKSLSRTSMSATKFLDGLEICCGIKIQREVSIGGRVFDGRVKNYLIEIDGTFWHSTPKQKKIDKEKDSIARQEGYQLLRYVVNRESDIPKLLHEVSGESPWQ